MNWKFNKYELGYLVLFISLFAQFILGGLIPIVSLSDELFAVLGIIAFLSQFSRKIVWGEYPLAKKVIYYSFSLVLIGWIPTFIYHIQPSFFINLQDCFTILKLFFVFYFSLWLLRKCRLEKILTPIYCLIKYFIIAGFIFLIPNQLIDMGMTSDVRFGFKSFKFIVLNTGEYSSCLILCVALLHLYSYYTGRSTKWLKILSLILIIFTFRGKSFGWIAAYAMVLLFINRYNKLSVKSLTILVIFGIAGGYFQIKHYFLENETPRAVLLAYGVVTANDYLPFGAGFSTYGSNMAKLHYSPLYTKYGFSNFWGLNETETQFLNDNFWPMIMGQFGWVGTIIFIGLLLVMFKFINEKINSKQLKIAALSVFISLVISSAGGPIFVHYIGCASIIIFSLILKGDKINPLNENAYELK